MNEQTSAVPGRDYIGLGVGMLMFDSDGRVFMAKRGSKARNEIGTWEFPGGEVRFGERCEQAIRREMREEYSVEVGPLTLLGVFDHIIESDKQHWISITYAAAHVAGRPTINEPENCSNIGWYRIDNLPSPISLVSQANADAYRVRRMRPAIDVTTDVVEVQARPNEA